MYSKALLALCLVSLASSGESRYKTKTYKTTEYTTTTTSAPYQEITRATCRLDSGKVKGDIVLEQYDDSSPVTVTGSLKGLKPGKHGFHVYEYGNVTGGCYNIGGHFNPYNKYHGGPSDKIRHVGDLGNIEANKKGEATIYIQDSLISLNGYLSIVGRAIGVTKKEDDLGRGGNAESKKTGNSGRVIACCVIELGY